VVRLSRPFERFAGTHLRLLCGRSCHRQSMGQLIETRPQLAGAGPGPVSSRFSAILAACRVDQPRSVWCGLCP
jgi:hypothetical protein